MTYDINTLEELLAAITNMPKEELEEATLMEIIDDGFTTGAINPELKSQVWRTIEA